MPTCFPFDIEGRDVVIERLPLAPVSLVLVAVLEQIAVTLEQDALENPEILPRGLDRLHHVGVAVELLLIAQGFLRI